MPNAPKLKGAVDLPADVAAIRAAIHSFFDQKTPQGRLGAIPWGVYAFYDYDLEPIYVGQTYEGLGARVGRHLTNQRTDAVAMNVLDPFEVAEIAVWPLDLSKLPRDEAHAILDQAEYTLFVKVLSESALTAVLNEKAPRKTELYPLDQCYRGRIIPEHLFPARKHPDVRIARRARTIAELARVISERKVTKGLRQTLLTQAKRLERLAAQRLAELAHSTEERDAE